jgi:hypothetical protein
MGSYSHIFSDFLHREELVAYYSKLTEEAARREQKALWKIRRHKLDKAREVFLLTSEVDLKEEVDHRAKMVCIFCGLGRICYVVLGITVEISLKENLYNKKK